MARLKYIGLQILLVMEPQILHLDKTKRLTEDRIVIHRKVMESLNLNGHTKLLDVGCGVGEFLEAIKDSTVQKVGVDIDCECVAISKRYVPEAGFIVSCGSKLPFPNGFFDIVTAICILEHIDNPTALIRETYRVCREQGLGIFVTPNLGRPLRVIRAMERKPKHERTGHRQGWDYHLLEDCLANNGWKVEKIVTRFVDCPAYEHLPRMFGSWLSHRLLEQLFPRVGSELYAFCKK